MKKWLFLLVFVPFVTYSKPIPLSSFAKKNQFEQIKISPDGKHLAATVPVKDRTILVVLNIKDLKVITGQKFGENEHVRNFHWINDERIIFTKSFQHGWAEQPVSYGQIYAMSIDNPKREVIFGFQGQAAGTISKLRKGVQAIYAYGEIVHLLPNDPKHIMILSYPYARDEDGGFFLYKLNVYTAKRKRITMTPIGNMEMALNNTGMPILGFGIDRKGEYRSFKYEKNEWQDVADNHQLSDLSPIITSEDNNTLYLQAYRAGGPLTLYKYRIQQDELSVLFQDKTFDIDDFLIDPITNDILGVSLMSGKVSYTYFDDNNKFVAIHKGLLKAFPEHNVEFFSSNKDGSLMIVRVSSDKNPGDFYLYNTSTNGADYIASKKSWLKPEDMASKEPIEFQTRDKTNIHGYLTLPNNDKNTKHPLVVYVHGGPYKVQDTWRYEDTVQMLANNGYAVLQVNYRGSGGYGLDFEEIAYQKGGTLIQNDIIDGTKWALKLPYIDNDKVCIMGWSFGGYSATMAPLIEPGLFKCSIAAAGPYNLELQASEADYTEVDSVNAQAKKIYGSDPKLLKQNSPITHIKNLKTPIFVVHGGKDKRVPDEHAFQLKEALDDLDLPYQWMFKEKEGHGFTNPENVEEFYQQTLAFLKKHMGS